MYGYPKEIFLPTDFHTASAFGDRIIIVGGLGYLDARRLIEERGGGQRYRRNVEDYALDVGSGVWRRLTNRNWRQFSIRQEDDGLFIQERRLSPENLVPRSMMAAVVAEEKWKRAQILVKGIPVSIIVGVHCIEVIIEGDLPSEISVQVAEQVRVNAEAAIKRPCVVEEK